MIYRCGNFSYEMITKKVKNISIRITTAGEVKVTIPFRSNPKVAMNFVEGRQVWIEQKLQKVQNKIPIYLDELVWTKEKEEKLNAIIARIYPRFVSFQIIYPQIKYRKMRGCYGNCHTTKNLVTLNKVLADLPEECAEYVVAHELAHLIEANHSQAFYRVLARVMPDYKQKEKGLLQYALHNTK